LRASLLHEIPDGHEGALLPTANAKPIHDAEYKPDDFSDLFSAESAVP
jgi:hypothetical protein